jgi:hypothetical protein
MKEIQYIEVLLGKAIEKSKQDPEKIADYFDLWLDLLEDYKSKLSFIQLVSALEIKHSQLNAIAYDNLTVLLKEDLGEKLGNNLFNKNSSLSILGKSDFQKNDLKKLLKRVKIKYDTIPSNQTTHLLVSKNISIDELNWIEEYYNHYIFLTEELLLKEIKKKAGEEKNVYLSQLLQHEEETNVELALELLKNEIDPRDYLTELFCVNFFTNKDWIQNETLVYLKKFGYAFLINNLDKIKTMMPLDIDDLLIRSNIHAGQFYRYAYFRNSKDYSFFNCALLYLNPKDLDQFLDDVINLWTREQPHSISIPASVDFERISGKIYQNHNLRELIINVQMVNPFKELPKGIAALSKLERLEIYTSLGQFPKELEKLFNLKNLTINCVSIKNLDSCFSNGFDNLEFLELYMSCFETLPKGIGHLKNLKKLNISWNYLTDLSAELEKLTHLKILNLENNRFSSIPKVLYKMIGLEKLNIRTRHFSYNSTELEKLQKSLPNCEIIY